MAGWRAPPPAAQRRAACRARARATPARCRRLSGGPCCARGAPAGDGRRGGGHADDTAGGRQARAAHPGHLPQARGLCVCACVCWATARGAGAPQPGSQGLPAAACMKECATSAVRLSAHSFIPTPRPAAMSPFRPPLHSLCIPPFHALGTRQALPCAPFSVVGVHSKVDPTPQLMGSD